MRQILFVVVLGFGLSSCDRTLLPTTPPPTTLPPPPPPPPPPPGQSSVTLSGVVFDHTSEGPLPRANIPLLVHAWPYVFIEVTSDAMGRYSVSGVPSGVISIAPAAGSGYYAPCPAGSDVVRSNSVFDVNVVSAMLLSTTGAPSEMPVNGSIWVSGDVFERGPEGRRPIAGASVNLEGDGSDPRLGSTTLTDAAGHYLLCPPIPSTGTDQYGLVRVSREGYRSASLSAFLGWDYTGVNIELIRN